MNLLQQTHLSAGPGKPSASAVQQLQQQQQQLVAQMQMTQQALMLGQSLDSGNKAGRERHESGSSGSGAGGSSSSNNPLGLCSDGSLKENRPDNNNGDFKTELNGKYIT